MSKEIMHNMLQDIVTHFSKDPKGLRSVAGSALTSECLYHPDLSVTPKSIGCAIGMYIGWKTAKEMDYYGFIDDVPLDMLPEWMRDLNRDFLKKCQSLHDNGFNWDDDGLSENGKDKVMNMCKDFELEEIKFG